jgi:hypothetical protein
MTSIHEAITSLLEGENADSAFIVAAAINIYNDAMRRRHGRLIYGPADVLALFEICKILLDDRSDQRGFAGGSRSARPSAEEEEAILTAVTDAVED